MTKTTWLSLLVVCMPVLLRAEPAPVFEGQKSGGKYNTSVSSAGSASKADEKAPLISTHSVALPIDNSVGDAYHFPVTPGTAEWKRLGNPLAACQIPEDTLKKISTKGLMETTLNYPFFEGLFSGYNCVQDGFDYMHKNFNGVRELLGREDAGRVLLAQYRAFISDKEIEILLAQPAILNTFTEPQRREALQLAVSRYKHGKTIATCRRCGGMETELLMGRILVAAKYAPFIGQLDNSLIFASSSGRVNDNDTLKRYLEKGCIVYAYWAADEILTQARMFLQVDVTPVKH